VAFVHSASQSLQVEKTVSTQWPAACIVHLLRRAFRSSVKAGTKSSAQSCSTWWLRYIASQRQRSQASQSDHRDFGKHTSVPGGAAWKPGCCGTYAVRLSSNQDSSTCVAVSTSGIVAACQRTRRKYSNPSCGEPWDTEASGAAQPLRS